MIDNTLKCITLQKLNFQVLQIICIVTFEYIRDFSATFIANARKKSFLFSLLFEIWIITWSLLLNIKKWQDFIFFSGNNQIYNVRTIKLISLLQKMLLHFHIPLRLSIFFISLTLAFKNLNSLKVFSHYIKFALQSLIHIRIYPILLLIGFKWF